MTSARGRLARLALLALLALLASGILATVWSVMLDVTEVMAASPTPTGVGIGDPRSSGQGPGLVGDPLAAILIVLAIAVASVVVTGLWVRYARPDRGGPRA